MNVTFRVDASPGIGSGHLMRCLCLADELQRSAVRSRFACRSLPEHLREQVERRGHVLTPLPPLPAPAAPAETAWNDAQQLDDARGTVALLDAAPTCDVLVVDHYGLGSVWEAAVRQRCVRLMVIDDLARAHDCDILLDQNFHADSSRRYAGRVPEHCELLLGPRFALLRPEFAQARSRVRIRDGAVRRAVVFLGGMDERNFTETVLQALQGVRQSLQIDVVIGPMHPARARIEAMCAQLNSAICHVQTSDIAALFAQADLAIGAGGTATWERCAVGVPTLALCIAENQRELLGDSARAGLLYFAADSDCTAATLTNHLQALLENPALREHLSSNGMALVDGRGVQRVAAALAAAPVSVRPAHIDDCDAVYVWRNDPQIRATARDARTVTLTEHRQWFKALLQATDRFLLIGERDGEPLGVVRFDAGADSAEVSIYLVPAHLGRGAGAPLLLAAESWLRMTQPRIHTLHAEVLADNAPSQRLFERCSYHRTSAKFSKRFS
jgi:UDP-2,4-diacetamido-2,4,6-trideoxy-beta-L-altropyranose hydrolase